MDAGSPRSPRHERVLLVDDDPDIRDFIELRLFRDLGSTTSRLPRTARRGSSSRPDWCLISS
jgi:hypothetical protein